MLASHTLGAVAWLGQGTIPDPSQVSPGIKGFLVMFALAAATGLLIRSMVRHLRKVRYSQPPDQDSTTI